MGLNPTGRITRKMRYLRYDDGDGVSSAGGASQFFLRFFSVVLKIMFVMCYLGLGGHMAKPPVTTSSFILPCAPKHTWQRGLSCA